MISFLAAFAILGSTSLPPTPNLSKVVVQQSDEEQIRQTIRDYIEGYYLGDAKRVESALSPELAKRVVAKTKEGKEVLKSGSAAAFVKQAGSGEGPKYYPEGKRKLEIKIFEIQGKIASAKAVGQDWTDYIHLARINGKWLIVNVIWT